MSPASSTNTDAGSRAADRCGRFGEPRRGPAPPRSRKPAPDRGGAAEPADRAPVETGRMRGAVIILAIAIVVAAATVVYSSLLGLRPEHGRPDRWRAGLPLRSGGGGEGFPRVLRVRRLGPARDLRVRRVLRHWEGDWPPGAHAPIRSEPGLSGPRTGRPGSRSAGRRLRFGGVGAS